MEEIGAAIQIIQVSGDLTIKTVGMTQEMIEMLVNIINYIKQQQLLHGGENTIEEVIKKDGTLQLFQFPESEAGRVKEALKAYKIPFSSAPDLRAGDGLTEVFISGADIEVINVISEKLKLGQIKNYGQWASEGSEVTKEFFSNQPYDTVPDGARKMEGKEDQTFTRFAVDLNTEETVDFSINKESIYKGIQDQCHVIRVPGSHKKEDGPYHVHIPELYCRSAESNHHQTLLLRLPDNVQCKVTDSKGMERWHTSKEIHDMGFSEVEQKAREYVTQKTKQRAKDKLHEQAVRRSKKKTRL